jgi:hypothetical protein
VEGGGWIISRGCFLLVYHGDNLSIFILKIFGHSKLIPTRNINGPEQANILCDLLFLCFCASTREFLDFVASTTGLEAQLERGFFL